MGGCARGISSATSFSFMPLTPESFQNHQVVVTGASGFIGRAVAMLLTRCGARVRAVARRPLDQVPELEGVQWVRADLTDPLQCRRALADADVVFHVAGDYRFWAPDRREILRNNLESMRCLLECASEIGVRRVVCTGTPSIFEHAAPGRFTDESQVIADGSRNGPYKQAKLAAWQLARQWTDRLDLVHVFPTAVIGAGDARPTPTGRVLVEFAHGRIPFIARTGLSFVPVESVAEGHLLAMLHGRRGENYLLSGENLWLDEFLEMAGRVLGRAAPRQRCPYYLGMLTAWLAERFWAPITGREPFVAREAVRMSRRPHFFTSTKAERELGYQAGPAEAAVVEALDWFEQHGMVPARTRTPWMVDPAGLRSGSS